MSKLYFSNPGEIDMAAVTTMGVSVKDSDTAIGYFGTGLKFALAVVLRGGGKITLWSGLNEYRFSAKPQAIRGQTFSIVHMNGAPLGFTVSLGRDWEPWMAYRELSCNATDEGGGVGTVPVEPKEGTTVIVVESDPILQAHTERKTFLIPEDERPIHTSDICEAYEAHEGAELSFYRGVAVSVNAVPSRYRYNVLQKVTLTEDRTAKYQFQITAAIATMWMRCRNTQLLRRVLAAPNKTVERDLTWSYSDALPCQEWLDVASQLIAEGHDVGESVRSVLKKHRGDTLPTESVPLDSVRQQELDRAIALLKRQGYNVDMLPIIVTDKLGHGTLGRAENGTIYVSTDCFLRGDICVAHALLEEWLHITRGYEDYSLEMQNWLFDNLLLLVKRIDALERTPDNSAERRSAA